MLKDTIRFCELCGNQVSANWLKSLKDRVQPQPRQEWSEEDERERKHCIDFLNHPDMIEVTPTVKRGCIDWLKSLRPQSTWKPTEEQIKALHDLNLTGCISYAGQGQVLIELYKDLKKLREG